VQALRAEHPGAAHVCWALMAGGQSAANDDGEPGGTAGRPMLEVLRHQQLEGVLATVVRYFGGVKLGAGGLVRAYTDAVAQALIGAPLVPRVAQRVLCCTVPYDAEGVVRRELAAATIHHVRHEALVHLCFSLAVDRCEDLMLRIRDATQGRVQWQESET
jgi:putative IMPACT (imprinted ancient) family translation regulator